MMNREEYEYMETSAQKIMEQLCLVQSLGRILEKVYINLINDEIKPADIEYLIRIQNKEMNILKSKLTELEKYLMVNV